MTRLQWRSMCSVSKHIWRILAPSGPLVVPPYFQMENYKKKKNTATHSPHRPAAHTTNKIKRKNAFRHRRNGSVITRLHVSCPLSYSIVSYIYKLYPQSPTQKKEWTTMLFQTWTPINLTNYHPIFCLAGFSSMCRRSRMARHENMCCAPYADRQTCFSIYEMINRQRRSM